MKWNKELSLIIIKMMKTLFLFMYLSTAISQIVWSSGSVKYPIIWDTDFDDFWYSQSSTTISYNTSYIDDALLSQDGVLYLATRFHNYK